MAIDSLLAKIVLGMNPSERELRNWLSSKVSKSRDVAKVQKVLDLPSKTKILIGAARHNTGALVKALVVRKVAKEIHRKLFNL